MIDWLKKNVLARMRSDRKGMSVKEKKLMDTLACPNCGNSHFIETHENAAVGFRCDCGLEFNLMPELRIVEGMTICLQRWKRHVRVQKHFPYVSVNRGGICVCDINHILGQLDSRRRVRWLAKFRAWTHKHFKISV